MAYSIFKTGGKQYKVSKGDTLEVELLDAETGDELAFDTVLCTAEGDQVQFGAPFVKGAEVKAQVVEHLRAPKVTAFKYKRRKGYHKTKGHRQPLTRIQIVSI